MKTPNPIDTLRERGFVQDVTDEAGLRHLLDTQRVTFYVGFDPTAPSLHAGNLVGMMAMSHLQRAGHRPIAIAGGATGRIGDPSGRDSERELLDDAALQRNLDGQRRQMGEVLDLTGSVTPGPATSSAGLLLDNHDWIGPLSFLDFLRDVGKHFSVNSMIARESVRKRLEERDQGISYTEFSYALLQSYDFAHLFDTYDCRLQGGGSDQWGNITAGIDLTRRLHGAEVFGLTWPLLTTADGAKFGKSAGNAIWLDPEMTSAYAYYQYWLNSDDRDVVKYLSMFTYLSMDEVAELEAELASNPQAREAHRVLAREATRVVHGDDGVAAAENATAVLFGGEPFAGMDDAVLADAFAEAPTTEMSRADLDAGIGVLDLLSSIGAAESNSAARRHVQQGAVRLNNAVVEDASATITAADLASPTSLVVRVGKKRYFLARFR